MEFCHYIFMTKYYPIPTYLYCNCRYCLSNCRKYLRKFLLLYGGIQINKIRILILATLILTLSSCVGAAAVYHANATNSIQAAVNSATSSGDIIIVDPGTYTENIDIFQKFDLLIMSSEGPGSTIVAANNSDLDVFKIRNSDNVTIQGLNITGAGTNHAGVYVYQSNNCKVKDNILHDDSLGVYPFYSDYTLISNNTATKSLLAGVGRAVIVEYSNYNTVSGNTVSNNNIGISVSDSNGATVSGNTVNLSASYGILLEDATSVTAQNNNVSSSGSFGIYLASSTGNFLRSNTVYDYNTSNGINLVLSSGNEVSSNTVSNPSIITNTHGIFLNTSHNNVISSNTVTNNDYGIAMRYSNNNSVLNNTASTNNRGIYIAYTSSLNTLSGNQANSNTNNGIILDNAAENTVTNNTARLNTGTTSSSGIVIGSSSNNNINNNNASSNRRGIYISSSSSSGNTISSNTVNSNSYGIYVENAGANNNITRNTAGSNSVYGIFLSNSNNTYVLNNVAPYNAKGIYVNTSYQSVISNNIASNNTNEGIMLSLSNNNTLSNNTVDRDSYGISLNSSRSNNISGNRITWSTSAGMFLCAQSKTNLIYNNYLNNSQNTDNNNNESTWNIANTSGTNIAGGYYLGGNFWGDPSQKNDHSQTKPDANGDGFTDEIYVGDNLVDNLPLVTVYRVLPSANFNTNATSGNVPLTIQFTDLSQNATGWSWDFGDGASSPERNTTHTYSAAGNYTVTLTASNDNGTATKTAVITAVTTTPDPGIIYPEADFTASPTSGTRPLTVVFTDTSRNSTSRSWDVNGDGVADSTEASFAYTYYSKGDYTATLTAINTNGTATKSTQISVEGGGSSGGGGGGGGGSPEPAKNVEVKEISQTFIANGKPIKFDFTKNATCVVYVGFDSKKTAGKTTTIAEQLKNKSTLTSSLPDGEVYRYFNVWVGNSGFATSTNIDNPVICFKVLKSWVQDNNIDKDSIALNRYSNKTWEQLPASQLKEDSKYLYFTADVSGYSFFAITGKSKASSPEEGVTEIEPDDDSGNSQGNTGDTGSEAGNESGEEETKGSPGFGMVCGIVGLSAAFLYRRK
jgi:PGF-pre-PGF domain-containing protein